MLVSGPRNSMHFVAIKMGRRQTPQTALALLDRKVHKKRCARTRVALNGDRSTVGLHRMFDDRQAKTGATGVPRPVLVDAVETLENMRLVALGGTTPPVVHNDTNRTAIAANLKGDLNGRRAAMLQGVIHQIVKRLFYSKSVGLD